MYTIKNMSTNMLFLLVSFIQLIMAVTVSQSQSLKIKKNARETKYIQLGFAFIVFISSLGQTLLILKKIKSARKI
ncbi:hypothetical protein [Bacillus suaedaesalsae]|uniref:Uncharacterized protein n=1 Tax=Bacillus suaedaesalsae TaxID=2810349 RepID=A0ABS2DIM2_9BACI|nr:hypothetical protein [Bacillus suaedaesalsae]MBM6617850.1 hypothetical protein [Bacillus suaedaesalsae]